MKSFEDRLREDRRLVVLRLLREQPGYRLNSSNIHAGLQHLGVVTTRDHVLTDLHWLAEQNLVRVEEAVPGVEVATITARGDDVAAGRAMAPGVSQPSPH